jgi:hypothetical protein
MRKRRHLHVPGRALTWCSVTFCLALLLCLVIFRQAAVRLWVSAVAVPFFLWTGTLLRWRINGNLKEALTWSFLSGISGVAVWVLGR